MNTAIFHEPKLADVQQSRDHRKLNINKVGIKGIRHPLRIRDRSGEEQHTVAEFNMYVFLPHNFKGTHMSRFVEILESKEKEITVKSFQDMLPLMLRRLGSHAGTIEMKFPYFVSKEAPVTKVKSLMDYEVQFIGHMEHRTSELAIKVVVPVTSLCPCSKEISKYGAHNQRSHITITATVASSGDILYIEDLIDIAESSGSCELYGLLKRPDEKYVTEKAYENPKFVEDIVRDAAKRLNEDERVLAYTVEAENFESIHNHSAYARIEHDKRLTGEV
ncbi:MAG: GTP cyclohydrolase FolE2 [Leptospiraceae bacterium]|nr:GTP cyclohydrolase FolE2 [Leptospiraceae bacterium]MDW8307092.1 GTP cyclohydrolase FolE2 [Leptospiraceae bacterium]